MIIVLSPDSVESEWVEDFVGQYVDLSPAGRGLCPFHHDQHFSFSVNAEKNYSPAAPVTDWPAPASPTTTPGILLADSGSPDWRDKFACDTAGNPLSVLVLVGMLESILWAVSLFKRTQGVSLKGNWSWIISILCIIGFGVAGYLAYVDATQVEAVCRPVGDCNPMQRSEYARNFLIDPAVILSFCMTTLGTLFSIYLTFLEPFVIGATCAGCLTSAVLMTVFMLLSVRPAKSSFARLQMRDSRK